jgi:hypothetical protein
MTFTPYSRDLGRLLETVRSCLLAGRFPPDPITVVEYYAFVREFPGEAYRWQPPAEVRVRDLGEMEPAFSEKWNEQYGSTILKDPARHGRLFTHAINAANQEGPHE